MRAKINRNDMAALVRMAAEAMQEDERNNKRPKYKNGAIRIYVKQG